MTKTLGEYERWFRYEEPRWQTIAREWLYYVAQQKGGNREDGRLGITTLFMDAFWWWGNYIPFSFCEELLKDWAEMADVQGDDTDRVWDDWLRDLYLRYPKGWRRQATPDDWRVFRQRLLTFLERRPEFRNRTDKRVRHVRGLLLIYLAEAERFLDPRSRRVDEHLLAARELFAADDDGWDAAWVEFYQADAALGRGDERGAVAAADAGWRDLSETDDDDAELTANLHRVHADAAWARGDRGLSLDLYARAALHAYKFQVAVGGPDIPPVDEYTQAFMTEMHERAAEKLAALHEAGEDQAAREACARIRRFFSPYWEAAGQPGAPDPGGLLRAGKAGELVGQVFPPPPDPADLHQPGTAYEQTATEVLYEMEDELTQPPGG